MPQTRMTNTVMLGGRDKVADMLSSTRRGLYAVNFGRAARWTSPTGKFVFQCTEAYLIERRASDRAGEGRHADRRRPQRAHPACHMIGDDFAYDPGIGVCGKGGQSVPVGIGQPSLKIGRA
jgi:TldD protein